MKEKESVLEKEDEAKLNGTSAISIHRKGLSVNYYRDKNEMKKRARSIYLCIFHFSPLPLEQHRI
jgi:hypothetical protein